MVYLSRGNEVYIQMHLFNTTPCSAKKRINIRHMYDFECYIQEDA